MESVHDPPIVQPVVSIVVTPLAGRFAAGKMPVTPAPARFRAPNEAYALEPWEISGRPTVPGPMPVIVVGLLKTVT